jgi:two-component system NarL family sensor kinase
MLRRRTSGVHHALMVVRRPVLLWLLAACGPLLLVLLFVELSVFPHMSAFDSADFENTWPNLVFGLVLPPLGALILTRLPRHPIGWIFLGCGVVSAITLAVYPYAHQGLRTHDLPGALAAAWVSEWIWGLGLIPFVTLGVLLFPDGRPPTPRWRWLLVVDIAAVVLVFAANAFHPGRLQNHPAAQNPLGLPLPAVAFAFLQTTGMALFLLGFFGGIVAAVVRWRRAEGTERTQLAWVAFAIATLAVALIVPWPGALSTAVLVVAVPLLPLSIAAAILRGHLYGIEVVVRRSLVYATLTVVLLLGYAAVVATFDALLRGRAGPVAALAATAFVAVAFAPVQQRAQRGVDRLLYGEGRDPYAVLSGVGRRLEQPVEDLESVLADMAAAVAGSLRLPYVRIETAVRGAGPAAEVGIPTADLHEVPLTFRGETVGRLLAAPRSPRDPFRAADLRLLDDLGRQIAVAVHATRLAADLQRSREGLVAMREEERRRIRRDLHDGLGPALAGVALGLDAIQRMTGPNAPHAAQLAERLKVEVQESLADVRRLVEDLRPPDLDQLGLVGALQHQAGKVTARDPGLDVDVEGHDLPLLPAAVEVAAYRIATEALTNVGRHAEARSCRILLAMDDPTRLRVEIEDDGVGLRKGRPEGVGLTAMRERAVELGGTLHVCRRDQGGTLVTARIPVGGR